MKEDSIGSTESSYRGAFKSYTPANKQGTGL